MTLTLAGNNSFGIKNRLNDLVESFKSKYGDLAIERLDGEEVETQQIIDALQNLPFLVERKLVVLRDLGANKTAAEAIEQILESASPQTDLVIVEPNPDKRTSYYKTLQKKTKFESFEELDARGLAKWLVEEAKKLGGELSFADASYLVERLGPTQQALSQEIRKLHIYNPKISRESIDLLTEATPQTKIFDLLDAAFAGQKQRSLKLYADQRAQSVEPQMIMAMIAWQLRALAAVKLGASARELGLSPFTVNKASRLASSIDLEKLKDLVARALELDCRSKNSNLDLDEALKTYLITI